MAKLHELLAVEGDLEGTYKKILEETTTTFAKKPGLFFGFSKELEMFADSAGGLETPNEYQELTDTVHSKLEYTASSVKRYFDAVLQKEMTNQTARADLVVDGKVIADLLPATFLLGLETKLKALRKVYEAIPTLAPGKKWVPDPTKGEHVYLTDRPDEKFKTAKTFKHKVLYEATDKHPAQIEKWEETENVGKYVTTTWSGMLTSAEKSEMIGRLDKLLRAVKKARQRANTAEVVKGSIGDKLFAFINNK